MKGRTPTAETVTTVEQARWFAEEVFPHESSLRTYLRASFPGVRDVDDIVQECYLRMFRTRAVQPIESARAFLFSIARRMSIDLVRKDHRKHGHEVLVDPMSLQLADPRLQLAIDGAAENGWIEDGPGHPLAPTRPKACSVLGRPALLLAIVEWQRMRGRRDLARIR